MTQSTKSYKNPFRPGAGHMPPHLAGRKKETDEFRRLLGQDVILENLVLTGLRGTGKTVLMETWKPIAYEAGWKWVGADLSESASLTEERFATRLLTDLAPLTSALLRQTRRVGRMGIQTADETVQEPIGFDDLKTIYDQTPGLVEDKLKGVLETVWEPLKGAGVKGIIFAYDEAQNLADHAEGKQYPLSLLLDVFQSIQRKEIPFMLLLTGLPTLFPKLVEARTFAERMFRVIFLDRLNDSESREAVERPIKDAKCPVSFSTESVDLVVAESAGYPYFIQFICREVFDLFLQRINQGLEPGAVPVVEITRKLDSDFFSGQWNRLTDRQRELMIVIAYLEPSGAEFSVQEIKGRSASMPFAPFSPSHISQILNQLIQHGLVYKNRHGRYCFAVPLMDRFIRRQIPL